MEDEKAARPRDRLENIPKKEAAALAPLKHTTRIAGTGFEEAGKIIRDGRRQDDVGVEAASPGTGLQHVPEADALSEELRKALLVGFRTANRQKRLHEMPEEIARMGIVLAGP